VPLTLTEWYPVKAAGLFAIIITLVVARRAQHPFLRFGSANATTIVRALFVAMTAGFIGEDVTASAATSAVALGAMAAALDAVDGWLARRTRMTSGFGARFDVEIDALLIQVLAILVWRHGKAGVWVLASGLLRYAFVAAGWALPWMRSPLPGSVRGKAICAAQIVALLVALSPLTGPPASDVVAAVGLGVLSYSFLIDTIWLWNHR
jgi:phosphatidylglycerophosphate synthase